MDSLVCLATTQEIVQEKNIIAVTLSYQTGRSVRLSQSKLLETQMFSLSDPKSEWVFVPSL